MEGEGVVLEDDPDLFGVLLEDPIEDIVRAGAVGTLLVDKGDDGHRRLAETN